MDRINRIFQDLQDFFGSLAGLEAVAIDRESRVILLMLSDFPRLAAISRPK